MSRSRPWLSRRIHISASDPRHDNKVMKWVAEADWPDLDIMVLRNAMPFLAELPEVAERFPSCWRQSKTIDGAERINDQAPEKVELEHRNSASFELHGNTILDVDPLLTAYSLLLKGVEGSLLFSYLNANPHAQVAQSCSYEVLRYREGERFGEHVDVVRGHPELGHRRLAFVGFCNEVERGGQLWFPRQGVRVVPEPGTAVIFPANFTHPHESLTVEKGTKYSVVTWFF